MIIYNMKLTEKLLKIQGAEFRVDKDGKNPHFKSSYVTLDNLLSVLLPLATELKLVIIHYIEDNRLITKVIDAEVWWNTDYIASGFPIYQEDPQKIGSAITYAKRYNLGAIFNIITEVDDDGNSISGDNHKKKWKELIEYIDEIKSETDTNAIVVLAKEALELFKHEKQQEWIKREARQRTDLLNSNSRWPIPHQSFDE